MTSAELNRALLARQWLLDRVEVSVPDAVEHLVGLQAQATSPPYYGLAARLKGFAHDDLSAPLESGGLVRMTLMRGTVHLVTRRDAAFLRPLIQPMIERHHRGQFGRRMGEITPAQIVAAVQRELATGPKTAREIARTLGGDEEALANAVRAYAPLVQLPPRGIWGKGGQPRYAPIAVDPDPDPAPDTLVLRYLRAFGPATVMDCQMWCGLTRLKAVFERLDLLRFGDHYDVPEGPRPDPDTPAPVRFLGEYDNVLLAHADRSRIIPPGFPWGGMLAHGRYVNTLLVDGMLRGTWWLEDDTLAIRPFGELPRDEVEAEARVTAAFAGARDVRFEPALPSPA
jgi:hypothetical protein